MQEKGIQKKIMNRIFLSQRFYIQTALEVFIEDAAKHQVIITEPSPNTYGSFYLKTNPKISIEEV